MLLGLAGCFEVGPDFSTPSAPVADKWLESADSRVKQPARDDSAWWKSLNDPILDTLIATAYRQNLSLQTAGVRVLEARAQLGASIGELYPQQQQASGDLTRQRLPFLANVPSVQPWFTTASIGLSTSWEIDLWGKFRRAIQSADANLLASVASYDDVLVSLVADVASTYVTIRTTEEQLRITRENISLQESSLKIAQSRFTNGETSQRDVEQAQSELSDTEAQLPQLETSLQQSKNALSVLLGIPPQRLGTALGTGGAIPTAPLEVAVGIPADLLRRRPDIRLAEQQAATQSALIGVNEAELFPAFSFTGSFGLTSSNVGQAQLSDIFNWGSRIVSFGPAVQWNILNYGQITNKVRAQDAVFQQAILSYQNTVLTAQREVEDALIAYLNAQLQTASLTTAVAAAKRSADLALIQYREGQTDYTTVLTAEQTLLSQQDQLATSQGAIPQGLIALYRAFGGGWQLRLGHDLIPPEVREAMAKRTNWGGLLQPGAEEPPESVRKYSIGLPEW
jgi:NodT family efflux transporter outer membrane factor (OMF) lipoprotein